MQVNASPLDLSGNVVPVSLTYSSSNVSVATVDNFGQITTLAAGTTSIDISAGGQTAHLALTVDGNVTGSVQVAPASPRRRDWFFVGWLSGMKIGPDALPLGAA